MNKMKKQNKWEILFDKFMDLIEFQLVKYPDGFGVKDLQEANLSDIESERFKTASEILDTMERYENDYVVQDLVDAMENQGVKIYHMEWKDLVLYRDQMPDDYGCEFDYIDLICNHHQEVDLENCTYIEEK